MTRITYRTLIMTLITYRTLIMKLITYRAHADSLRALNVTILTHQFSETCLSQVKQVTKNIFLKLINLRTSTHYSE